MESRFKKHAYNKAKKEESMKGLTVLLTIFVIVLLASAAMAGGHRGYNNIGNAILAGIAFELGVAAVETIVYGYSPYGRPVAVVPAYYPPPMCQFMDCRPGLYGQPACRPILVPCYY